MPWWRPWPSSTARPARAPHPRRPRRRRLRPRCTQGSLSKQEAIDQLHEVRAVDRPDAAPARRRQARGGLRRGPHRLPRLLRGHRGARSTSVAGRRLPLLGRGRLRPGARPHRHRRPHRRGPRPHRHAARPHRRQRAPAHRHGLRRPGARRSASRSPCCCARASRRCCSCPCCSPTSSRASTPATRSRSSIGVGLAVVATVVTFFAVDALFSVLPVRPRGARGGGGAAGGGHALLRVVLADRPARPAAADGVPPGPRVEGGVGGLGHLAGAGRLHRRVPRGLRDGALLPSPLLVRARACTAGSSLGMAAAAVVLGGVAWAVLKMGRKLPVKRFLAVALVIVMLTSVAVLGNAMRALQEAAILDLHFLRRLAEPADLPRPGHRLLPDARRASSAQGVLIVVYLIGGHRHASGTRRAARPALAPSRRLAAGRRGRRPARVRARPRMGVRIGVDVGGTFTKAVAIDVATAPCWPRLVGAHHPHRPRRVGGGRGPGGEPRSPTRSGADRVELITYSTTQAVNALLEGDVAIVGVLGLGRQPDLRKAAKRTRLDKVELAPGRRLPTVHEFLDVTGGLDDGGARGRPRPPRGRRRHHDLRRRGLRPRRRRRRAPGRRGGPRPRAAGLRLGRDDRALRPRAAGGHRRAQRLGAADRGAHRGARRARRRARPGSTRR